MTDNDTRPDTAATTTATVHAPFVGVETALEDVRAGRMVIVTDDEGRENEGDFVMAAEKVTPDAINFMATNGRGLICLPMTGERLDELHIPVMALRNTSEQGTAFHVSIGAKGKITTGISAADRAVTVATATDPATRPEDISMPGHVFPLRARPGGVLERAGHTEAAVDLARMAGLAPAGVICEIMNEDGTMARRPQLEEVAARFGLHDGHGGRDSSGTAVAPRSSWSAAPPCGSQRRTASSRRTPTAPTSTTPRTSPWSRATLPASMTSSCACTRSA